MGAGRFICVALPFGLTVASLVCILISMLSGITNKDLDLFTVKTQNLSISSNSLENLATEVFKRHITDLTIAALNPGSAVSSAESSVASTAASVLAGNNITAADLGLADSYKVNLWNYCATTGSNNNCTKAKFNWASAALNTTALETLATQTSGVNVTLPSEVTGALKTFVVVSKWTQVVYIIAFVTCVVELFFGLFAICSRIGSCCTVIISSISTVAIIAASILATVQSSVVTGAIESTAKTYGVKASINTGFLAVTWLAVAFSLAGGLFWMFTMCCCAADHHARSKSAFGRGDDGEKLIPNGSYHPVNNPAEYNHGYAGQQHRGLPMSSVPASRGNGAYEPYSHSAI